jgi:hypothetical protein
MTGSNQPQDGGRREWVRVTEGAQRLALAADTELSHPPLSITPEHQKDREAGA